MYIHDVNPGILEKIIEDGIDKMNKTSENDIPCNCLKLRRASLAITKVYDKYLEPSGIKVSQYSILKSISRMEPVNVSNLAINVRLDRTTLVRNLKPLEQKGLISDISKAGNRNRQLILTERGKETLTEAIPLWMKAQDYVEQYLGAEDLSTLSSLLLKIEKIEA